MLSVKQMCYYAFLFIVMVITSAILPLGMSGQTAPKALTQNQIIELLKGGVPSPRVESLVSQDGIAQGGVWETSGHCYLHGGHQFTRLTIPIRFLLQPE